MNGPALGEFDIIARYFERAVADDDVLVGIGDDAAVLRTQGAIAVSVDTLVEGRHFPPGLPPEAIGYRALAVNLSDMAAMAARPRWITLALTLPDADEAWLDGFANGLFGLAERHGVSLVGGDLTRGPLTVSVQIIGSVEPAAMLTRSGGHIGDDVYVTGTLGDSAAGLMLIDEPDGAGTAAPAALHERFLWPEPRVRAGLALGPVASAAIDISDGLLADLGHLCHASGCGASIDVERLPLSAELLSVFPPDDAERLALAGGDDYELCFTAAPAQAQTIEAALAEAGVTAHRIGRLIAGSGVECRRDGEPVELAATGYRHF
jgi:thiamine-monophosphate kinase